MNVIQTNIRNERNTIISQNEPNCNDWYVTRVIKSQGDLAVVAYLKTLGEQNKLRPFMTAKEIADLGNGTPTGKNLSYP